MYWIILSSISLNENFLFGKFSHSSLKGSVGFVQKATSLLKKLINIYNVIKTIRIAEKKEIKTCLFQHLSWAMLKSVLVG